jgi:hypothetical protein
LIGPSWTAPHGSELQPKLQPGPSAPLELSRILINPRPMRSPVRQQQRLQVLHCLHKQYVDDEQHTEDDMDQTVTDRIEEQLKSAFPAGTIERVQVLEYGDDPEVEPGETAVRAFIARAGRPEGKEADKETVTAFEEANRAVIMKIRDELPRFIGWIEFLIVKTC